MAADRLPQVRELSTKASHEIMLGRIGSLLRHQYEHLLRQPVPERLADLIRRLP